MVIGSISTMQDGVVWCTPISTCFRGCTIVRIPNESAQFELSLFNVYYEICSVDPSKCAIQSTTQRCASLSAQFGLPLLGCEFILGST